ncbi:FecR domain-containing protein [Achromobacter sp. 2789STDY5608621]|uniref:FecR domain-containing protein n=1 Tax=Achromobacter sp. 2789STDY5608621 TaxID=1806496 RepID=UPI0006C3DEBB|nr:FecR domain-containing protein [Achromobacter sp. 2789STDY5608621]CUJ71405.1 fec operon regulator FecR [Achromobacter sp. 2789STDY5608621]
MAAAIQPASPLPVRADYESLKVAAEWYARLQNADASAQQRLAWQHWLDARPEHRSAWAHVEAVSRRFAVLRLDGERDAAEQAVQIASRRPSARRRAAGRILALGGVGVLGWLGWRFTPLPSVVTAWRSDYATGIGEQRQLVLADDTRVWLNTRSAINVRLDPTQRLVALAGGEILIDTAKDSRQRPFFVDTRFGRLQALGTRFTVRQADDDILLAVYEGQVRIHTLSGQEALVHSGEQTRYRADAIAEAVPADPAREAWSRGVILAENLSLGDLVAELGRYHVGYTGVDPRIAGLRVVGRYPANDLPRTLAMLERELPVRIQRTLPWWVTLEPK